MRIATAIIVMAFCLYAGGNALAVEMPALAKKYGCAGCHEIDKRLVGPAWMDVSRKYQGIAKYSFGAREYTLEQGLVMKVSLGGSGNWGTVSMPANDQYMQHQPDMKMLVRFILGLGQIRGGGKTSN